MELLYYIYYKESRNFRRRSDILFVMFQMLFFAVLPLSIINWFITLGWTIEKNDIVILAILGILLYICDYILYFRPSKRKEILKKYSGRYEFIDQSATLAYLLFFMLPLMLSIFICALLNVAHLPWQ